MSTYQLVVMKQLDVDVSPPASCSRVQENYEFYIVVKFQAPCFNTFRDMKFFPSDGRTNRRISTGGLKNGHFISEMENLGLLVVILEMKFAGLLQSLARYNTSQAIPP